MAEQVQPSLRLLFDGVPMDDLDSWLLELEVHERTDGASTLRLLLSMAPGDDGSWHPLEDPRFGLWVRVTAVVGIGEQRGDGPTLERTLFDGFVTEVEPTFGPQRVPDSTLCLSAMDAGCLLHLEHRNHRWEGLPDAEIARTIFTNYGFTPRVDATSTTRAEPQGALIQRSTDAEFLSMLARRNGFELYFEPESGPPPPGVHPGRSMVGHFHPPDVRRSPQPPLSLTPHDRPSLAEFTCRWDGLAPTRVLAHHLDTTTRRVHSESRSKPSLPKMGARDRAAMVRDRLDELGRLSRERTLVPTEQSRACVPHDRAELVSTTGAEFRKANWLASGKGVVQGVRYPDVFRARRPVELEGCGPVVDGLWYVRSARHTWRRNVPAPTYEVAFEAVRNALGVEAA